MNSFCLFAVPSPPLITSDKSLLKLIHTNSLPTANISCQTQHKQQQHHEELLKQLKQQKQFEQHQLHQQQQRAGYNRAASNNYSAVSPVSCVIDPNATPVAFSPINNSFLPPTVTRTPPTSLNKSQSLSPAYHSRNNNYNQLLYPTVGHFQQILSEQPRTVLNASPSPPTLTPQKPLSLSSSSSSLLLSSLSPSQPSTTLLSSQHHPTHTTTDNDYCYLPEQHHNNQVVVSFRNSRQDSDSISCFCANSSPINALLNIICKENGIASTENMNSAGGRRQRAAVNDNTVTARARTRTNAKDEKENVQR